VLTPKEAIALFQLDWKDKRAMLVNMVAMTAGLRIGEILALHLEDVGEEYLNIEWSFSEIDGLKSTKTNEPRTVPVMPQIRDALRKQGIQNPHGDGFFFFGEKPNRPWDQHGALKVLQRMLIQLKVGDGADAKTDEEKEVQEKAIEGAKQYWQKRNVVFHSWRHFYTSRMTDKLEARKVMLATGHKTESVFKGYSDHALESDLGEVAVTTSEVFSGIIPKQIGGRV
jgi:integrase